MESPLNSSRAKKKTLKLPYINHSTTAASVNHGNNSDNADPNVIPDFNKLNEQIYK